MKERILEFLKKENKSSAQFAEEIGVQPSGISHILSGRNNPSLDFVIKMLEKYSFLSSDWLLFGKGSMYKDKSLATLFEESHNNNINNSVIIAKNKTDRKYAASEGLLEEETHKEIPVQRQTKASGVQKIVWFYDNNSFEEYFPKKD